MKISGNRLLKITLISVGLMAMSAFILFKTPLFLSDIRPNELRDNYRLMNNGKPYLDKSMQAHGIEHWISQDSIRFDVVHTIHSGMARFIMAPDNNSPFNYEYISHPQNRLLSTFRSNNPQSPYIIGRDSQGVFRKRDKRTVYDQSSMIFFYHAIQHLIEFPFEMNSASIFEYIGEEKLNGISYDLVFATWEKMEPNADYDQYIIWINQHTGLIDRFDATGRGITPFAKAKVIFEYEDTKGQIILPKVIKVISVSIGESPVMTIELNSQTLSLETPLSNSR